MTINMSGLAAIAAAMRIAAVTAMTGAIGSTAIVMPIIAGVSVTMFRILIAMPVSVIKNRPQYDPCDQGNNHVIVVIRLYRLDQQPQY